MNLRAGVLHLAPSASGRFNPRREGIIKAQFSACNPKVHPEAQPAVGLETRDFVRGPPPLSPSSENFHFNHNAETYWLIGKAMAEGSVQNFAALKF